MASDVNKTMQNLELVLFLLFSVLGMLVLVFAVVKWQRVSRSLRNAEDMLYAHTHLFSSLRSGYYYQDALTSKETVSPSLLMMLDIRSGTDTFAEILSCFKSEPKQQLQDLFQELREGRRNFFVTLTVDVRGKERYLECIAERIHNAYGELSALVIWFHDVTHYVANQEAITAENTNLKAELKSMSTILNTLPLPVWKRNSDLTINYCNLTYSRLIEEADEDSPEDHVLELTSTSNSLAQLAHTTYTVQYGREHMIINGKRLLYKFTEIPLGEKDELVGFAEDITEVESTEKELQRHISAQSDLLESTASATAIFGADTRLRFFNNAFVSLWNLDELWLASEPTYGEILEVLREKRKLPEQANFPQFKQEQLRWFTDLMEPHNDFFHLPDGTALRVIVIPHALGGLLFAYEDMTDKLEFERSYNTLIAVQRATLDHLHEGVAVFGQNGCIRLSNPAFIKIWQLPPELLERQPHLSEIIEVSKRLYHYGEEWENFKNGLVARTLRRTSFVQRLERTDGSVIDMMCVPLPDGSALVTHVDVTDSTLVERSLRERNEALEEADRLKTEFLANVSYELRSPLTSIVGFSEVLNNQYFGELNERQLEYVNGIYKSSQYLMSLINDILDLASIEAGYMLLDTEEFDIYEVLHSVMPLIQGRVKENNLLFDFECEDTIGHMLGDPRRIKQMIFKLLSNGIKFTDAGGKITLGAKKNKSDEVVIWVEDTGIGIPPEEQLSVFDKFHKTESAKTHSKSGAGLGLSVVKKFVDLHGGHIELHSKPGVGTKVLCYLPRNNKQLLTPLPSEEKKAPDAA